MEIKELLKDKEIAKPIIKFAAELLKVYEGQSTHSLLDKKTAEIGLLLLDSHPDFPANKDNWAILRALTRSDKRYRKLFELIPEEGWKSSELKNLLVYLFGEEKAEYVSHAWDRMRFQMYQTGYLRRSFRAPENRELYFINQLNFLIAVIPQVYSYGSYPEYDHAFYDLSVSEQLRFSQHLQQNQLFRVWSAAIDLGNTEILKQAEDIIFNKDETGKVTRELIKALLNSEKKEAWQLVEKLLLAAQR